VGLRAKVVHLAPKLAALAIGILVPIFTVEIALRIITPTPGAPRLPLSYDTHAIDLLAARQAYVMFDPDLGWVPTPDIDRVSAGTRLRHNQAGLRAEQEYTPVPRPGIRRYAAYGDSFTYCEEVDLQDCWTLRLEENLRNSEVLNFGVPGYALDQAWLRYRRDGADWKPCAVLIGHMIENIQRMVNRFRPFYSPEGGITLAKPRFLLDGDSLVLLPSPARRAEELKDPVWVEANLGPHDAWYFPGTFVANPFDGLQFVNLARTAVYRASRQEARLGPEQAERMYEPGTESFDVLVSVLVHFAEQVRADGATPVVIIFPRKREIVTQRDRGTKVHAPLLDALRERGVPTLDVTEALAEQARRTDMDRLVVGHYRPLANATVARTLARPLSTLTAATCGR
jgi:hypothetical protein